MEIVLGLLGGLIGGGVVMAIVQQSLLKSKREKLIKDAELEGENIKKDKLLQAKENFLKLKEEHEGTIKEKERRIQSGEDRIRNKEKSLNQKMEDFGRKEKDIEKKHLELDTKIQALEVKSQELDKMQQKRVAELSKISGLPAEEAKTMLMEALKDEARTNAHAHIKEIVEEAKLNANREARKIVIQSIQRTAAEQTIENTVTVFQLESDEIKGQIIGREGRNIRAIEAATGVDLIVDDSLHTFDAGKNLFENFFYLLSKGGYYIIEDVDLTLAERYIMYLKTRGVCFNFVRLQTPFFSVLSNNNLIVITNQIQ